MVGPELVGGVLLPPTVILGVGGPLFRLVMFLSRPLRSRKKTQAMRMIGIIIGGAYFWAANRI